MVNMNRYVLNLIQQIVQKDCQARNLNREDAMDHNKQKKLIKIG